MKRSSTRTLTCLLSLVLVICLVACGNSSDSGTVASPSESPPEANVPESPTEKKSGEAEDNSLQRVLDSGVLRIGTEGNYIPFVYNDPDTNELVGEAVEVAEEVARRLGVKTEWSVANKWDGVLAGLDANRYDMVFCSCNPKQYSTAGKYGFTIPYTHVNHCLVVAGDNTEINSFEDLNGKVCGNALTSTAGAIAQKFGAECRNTSLAEAAEMISTGRIDAMVNKEISMNQFLESRPDLNLRIAAIYEPEDLRDLEAAGAAMQDSESLLNRVSGVIQEMLDDGTVLDIDTKYFGEEIATKLPIHNAK